jgi:hypothetical protein
MWWWLLPIGWVVVMLVLAAVSLWTPYQPVRFLGVFQGWVVFVPQFITIGITAYKTRAVRRAFAASGGRLCVRCGHDLSGLADTGRCPECGHDYDIELDRRAWKDAGIELKKP